MTTITALVLTACVFCYFFANIAQSRFSVGLQGRMAPMNLFQIGWMGTACLVLLIYKFLTGGVTFSVTTVLLAGTAGTLQVIGGMSLLYGMSTGPLGLTMLIFSMYIVVPPLLAVPVLHESATAAQIAGMLLIIVVLILSNLGTGGAEGRTSGRWWVLCVVSALCSGIATFCVQVHQSLLPGQQQREYTIASFAFGASTAFIFYLVLRGRDRRRGLDRYTVTARGFWAPMCGMALGQTGAQFCNLYNASRLPAIVIYPVTQLSTLMLTTLYGVLALHERLRKKDVLCLVLGCLAIVMMNL